tara:strand:- start:17828 stop:18877 length:1050 start_codon:yes stop_codon:yes gene_type:complete
MNFKSLEIKEFRESRGLLIDVRSPDEYYKGNMPNSINIPLFNNDERAYIGKKYKNAGRRKAVIEGLKIVEKKIDKLLDDIINAEKEYSEIDTKTDKNIRNLRIYCARGGMRSFSVQWLFNKFKFQSITLKGGYKSYRKWVLNNFTNKKNITLIGGKTGTGKTNILKKMQSQYHQVIDLEFLANHRGSTFGGLGMGKQPSNEQFENLLAEQLEMFDLNKSIYVEAESGNIGKCRIPFEFFKQMKISPRIEIIKNKETRINELIKTYSIFPKEELKNSVNRISKRLGPQRTKKAIESIDSENWNSVCQSVLEYYDKCYEYGLSDLVKLTEIDMTGKDDNEIIKEIIKNTIK